MKTMKTGIVWLMNKSIKDTIIVHFMYRGNTSTECSKNSEAFTSNLLKSLMNRRNAASKRVDHEKMTVQQSLSLKG